MMRLREIMSAPVETVPPSTSVAEASLRMRRGHIRHLVVTRGRSIVGVVSKRDLDAVDPAALVADRMAVDVTTASPQQTVQDAAKLLRGRSIGCLPIVNRERLVGMVTVADLLTLLGKGSARVTPTTDRRVMWRRGPRRKAKPGSKRGSLTYG